MKIWTTGFVALFLIACQSAPVQVVNAVTPPPAREYGQLIEKNTQKADKYSGLYQTFQADVTILTNEVIASTLKERGAFLQWDEKQYQAEREKAVQENAAYSKFFLRFYTPDRENDDLNLPKTIWKVFLEYNGNKFEGKVRKLSEKTVELQKVYPHFNRMSTPYEVTFSVPMSTIESGSSKVVLSSSLGSAEFVFPVKK